MGILHSLGPVGTCALITFSGNCVMVSIAFTQIGTLAVWRHIYLENHRPIITGRSNMAVMRRRPDRRKVTADHWAVNDVAVHDAGRVACCEGVGQNPLAPARLR